MILFSSIAFSQNDYQVITVLDYSRSNQVVENLSDGMVTGPVYQASIQPDFTIARSYSNNFFLKGDISFLPMIPFSLLYDKELTFDTGLFDFSFNKTFNPNRPIKMGPIEWYFGMGLGLGIKVFDNQGGQANAFFSYGLSFNSTINIGDNFQLYYLNTLNFSYNPKYDEMYRTSHEFFIFYDWKWKIKPSIIPYIETFRFEETMSNSISYAKTFRYSGFRFGVTKVLD